VPTALSDEAITIGTRHISIGFDKSRCIDERCEEKSVMGELQKITAHRRAEPDAVSFPAGLDDMLVRLFFWTIATIVSFAPASASGQGSATQPRASDGKPDLSGVWQVLNTAAWDIQDHSARLGVPAGESMVEGNEIPYQP